MEHSQCFAVVPVRVAATEALILEALRKFTRGRTVIYVSHQLRMIPAEGRVVVLRKGRMVEIGTRNELLANPDGELSRLWIHQERSQSGKRARRSRSGFAAG